MARRRVCVVTGSRAEYGLLFPLIAGIGADPDLQLQIVATGMHLSPDFGLTYKEIESDGFVIDAKVEMLLSSDSPVGVAKSIGLGVIGFSDVLDRLAPDVMVVLGDRFEILAVAQAAMVLQVPIAHLGGGDMGAGTYDNIIRHCITKMASLHFVTHEKARDRVVQLGERADRVFCFGSTSVENIMNFPMLSREALESGLGIKLKEPTFLVTYHPLTMGAGSAESELGELLSALEGFRAQRDCSIVFTKANADNGGRTLNRMLEDYVEGRDDCHLFDSLGQSRYLSMMKLASVVIGNSSSGIYEAPYLQTPTVDIGGRQRGRVAPTSVIRCEAEKDSVSRAMEQALAFDFDGVGMIYGDGTASPRILATIKDLIGSPDLATKEFVDMRGSG